ncbi:MAG: efflux transporter outer membrane subunit [Legionella sp.]|uniref:efflux transporter outer membrane subunit n=1 Tax=Legionella sp. TaxID=459 RepID=UPI0039E21608
MYDFRFRPVAFIGIILLLSLQTACMVGPNFRSPPVPLVKQYTETPLPAKTVKTKGPGGQAQAFLKNRDIPLLWWELFSSPEINELVHAGLAHNPTVAAAAASLREARENWKVEIGNSLLPSIDASMMVLRQRYSGVQIGLPGDSVTFSIYNPAFNLSYTLDLFGAARRQIESLRAQIDYQQFELIAAHLTLTSNIVTTAINIASYQAQIDATKDLIRAEASVLKVLKDQYRLGGISNADVLTQQTLVEQSKATLPPLEKNLSQSKHYLSTLIGTVPDGPLPLIKLERLHLPTELPLSVPAMLVRQRPDVRASEALLHAACAQIGVATANLFPQLTLTGSEGWINSSWSQLFTAPNNVWSIAAQVAQPLFHGGALFAQRRATIAAFDQAASQYKLVVLQAFQNVADVLTAIETDARALQAEIRAEDSARASVNLITAQYRLGGVNYINLLNAQQQYHRARLSRIQAQALRYTDTTVLFQALGGGWWHKPWCVKECL